MVIILSSCMEDGWDKKVKWLFFLKIDDTIFFRFADEGKNRRFLLFFH